MRGKGLFSIGRKHFLRCALKNHLSAFATSLGADVNDIVGIAHHLFIVFHHDDRIADITEILQGGDEPLIVALMQADARFVEDIKHVNQL